MATGKIRMAVSGLGRIGWPFYCAQVASHPVFKFVAVQDTDPGRRAEAEYVYGVKSYKSFGAMLAECRLDAVAIATPTHLHRAMVLEALRAGCHVMLEKPMAPDSEDAAVIVREAARRKRILTAHQPRRAEAYFQHLRAPIDAGTIGRIYHVRVGMFQFAIRDDWQSLRRFGGGMLNNYGAHALDQVLQLIGYDVKRLFCSLRIVASVGDAEDVVKVVLETKNGTVGEVDINQASVTTPYFIEVYGTRGTIQIPAADIEHLAVSHFPEEALPKRMLDPTLASQRRQYPGGGVPVREEPIAVDATLAVDVYDDFARAIRTGGPPFVRAEEPLALMRLIDRCREQAGRIVETRLTPRPKKAPSARKTPAKRRARSQRRS